MSTAEPEAARPAGWRAPITAPGPRGGDMLRSFALIRRDPLRFLEGVWREHGDVAQFPIPRPPTYLVTDPEAVKAVLVMNARSHTKRTLQYDTLAAVTGRGLLTADDPPWRAHRQVIQPAFHHEALRGIAAHSVAAVGEYLRRWEALPDGAVVDVEDAMMRMSLQVVAAALFGASWQRRSAELTAATVVALDEVVARARNPLAPPLSWPTPANRRLRGAVARLDAAVAAVLSQRESADSRRRGHSGQVGEPDLVDLLLANAAGPDPAFDRRGVRDELVTFLVAGHETIASGLSWTWQLLARHPEAAARLRAEVDAVLGGRPPTYDDVPRLVWTRAVIDETLRLFPPAWVLTRKSTTGQELGGCHVPAGSLLIISPWLVHRHPGRWDRPEAFEPQRFLARSARPAPDYLPFGLGPRLCVGREMALLESTLVVAAVAQRFELAFPAGTDPPAALASVTLRAADGLRMSLRRRTGAA